MFKSPFTVIVLAILAIAGAVLVLTSNTQHRFFIPGTGKYTNLVGGHPITLQLAEEGSPHRTILGIYKETDPAGNIHFFSPQFFGNLSTEGVLKFKTEQEGNTTVVFGEFYRDYNPTTTKTVITPDKPKYGPTPLTVYVFVDQDGNILQ